MKATKGMSVTREVHRAEIAGEVRCTAIFTLRIVADESGQWWAPLSILPRQQKPLVDEAAVRSFLGRIVPPGGSPTVALAALQLLTPDDQAASADYQEAKRLGLITEFDLAQQQTRALIANLEPVSYVSAAEAKRLSLVPSPTPRRVGDAITPVYPVIVDFMTTAGQQAFRRRHDLMQAPGGGDGGLPVMLGKDFLDALGSWMAIKNKLFLNLEDVWWPGAEPVNPASDENELTWTVDLTPYA